MQILKVFYSLHNRAIVSHATFSVLGTVLFNQDDLQQKIVFIGGARQAGKTSLAFLCSKVVVNRTLHMVWLRRLRGH